MPQTRNPNLLVTRAGPASGHSFGPHKPFTSSRGSMLDPHTPNPKASSSHRKEQAVALRGRGCEGLRIRLVEASRKDPATSCRSLSLGMSTSLLWMRAKRDPPARGEGGGSRGSEGQERISLMRLYFSPFSLGCRVCFASTFRS